MASSEGVGVGAMGMGALNVKEGGYDQMNAQLQNVTLSASEKKKKAEQQAKEKLEAAAVHAKLDKSFLLRLGLKAKQHTTIEDLEHLELRRSAIMKRAHGGSSWEVATQWDGTAVKESTAVALAVANRPIEANQSLLLILHSGRPNQCAFTSRLGCSAVFALSSCSICYGIRISSKRCRPWTWARWQ